MSFAVCFFLAYFFYKAVYYLLYNKCGFVNCSLKVLGGIKISATMFLSKVW